MSDNQSKLNELVSVHLGKAGDGTVVKPYVTPDEVDASLLVAVPRSLNRTQYEIDDENLPFYGGDAWNAYEFSTLLENGFPVSGWLKFAYSSHSPNIVESKSVKLYLNSYNMACVASKLEDLWKVEDKISADIEKAVGAPVDVALFIGDVDTSRPIVGDFTLLERHCDVENMEFNQYNESPDILKVIQAPNTKSSWRSNSLRSNCRVTNQPDWGDVFVYINSDETTVTPESLLQYIVSMRKENHFHEEICECIYKRLQDVLKPKELLVTCLYTRRGGIDINPVRASNTDLITRFTPVLCAHYPTTKTSRQ